MSDDIRILQFGTGRFLLAHADLFISEALDRGEAAGRIAVVQTTGSAESAARLAALRQTWRYPVRIRGLEHGKVLDEMREGKAIGRALTAATDWAEVCALAASVPIIISNTGDRGYDLDDGDSSHLLGAPESVPKSFPAKLVVLLAHRWQAGIEQPLSLFPCELIEKNGARLKELVVGLAREWGLPDTFADWLNRTCRFGNSLVDRIVAEPILPVGAVAEPYALWAIEAQDGLTLPCAHPAMVLTADLSTYERLKLQLLNLGHSYLAERWKRDGRPAGEIVREAMEDAALRTDLEAVWAEEVLPVFAADGIGQQAEVYVASVRDRFLNPFLKHRLADIAGNHEAKKLRRMRPVVERAEALGLNLAQPRLRSALAGL
jgi:tagaturonate reductase